MISKSELSEFSRNGNVQEYLKCLERTEGKIVKYTLLAQGSQEDFTDKELLWNYLYGGNMPEEEKNGYCQESAADPCTEVLRRNWLKRFFRL